MKITTTENFSPFSILRVRLELEAGMSSLFDGEYQIIHQFELSDVAQTADDFLKRAEELQSHGFEFNGKLTVISHHGHQQILTENLIAPKDPVVKAASMEELRGLASLFTIYARVLK